MKESTKIMGLGAACAACCALPAAAGLGIATASIGTIAGGLLAVGLAAGGLLTITRHRPAEAPTCQINGSCGCGPNTKG